MKNRDLSFLRQMFEDYRQRGYFASAVYAVFTADEVLEQNSVGTASVDTWFDFASLTKLFTSTAVLGMVDKGRFTLQTPVLGLLQSDIKSETYPKLAQHLGKTTVQALLTHVAGFVPWYPFYAQQNSFFAALEMLLAAAPLTGMNYSDINFMLLGELVKKQSGKGLQQVMSELCESLPGKPCAAYLPARDDGYSALVIPPEGGDNPLSSAVCSAKTINSRDIAVSCYGNAIEEKMCANMGITFDGFRDENTAVIGQANDGNCWYFCKGVSGHAGLFGPVAALVGLGQLYLKSNNGVLYSAMQDVGVGRGLGFEVDEKFPQGCGHTGFTGTSLWVSHKNGVGVAILSNRLAYKGKQPENLNAFRKFVHEEVLRAN